MHGQKTSSYDTLVFFFLFVTQDFCFALKFNTYFTNSNVSNQRVEVLQGYICNILLAFHSTYEPSPCSAHWLDRPPYNRSQHRGKFAMAVVN